MPRETVYPRTRGATGWSGPSHSQSGRSIPARAGQPWSKLGKLTVVAVYSRTRGATRGRRKSAPNPSGLSPHARGNLVVRISGNTKQRSIPARAGQPPHEGLTLGSMSVYPRTRGATVSRGTPSRYSLGLSPHARGNRLRLHVCRRYVGSIPARAGQPKSASGLSLVISVYPRTRGATDIARPRITCRCGLSPHARGNPGPLLCRKYCLGSIPARAGQPECLGRRRRLRRSIPARAGQPKIHFWTG